MTAYCANAGRATVKDLEKLAEWQVQLQAITRLDNSVDIGPETEPFTSAVEGPPAEPCVAPVEPPPIVPSMDRPKLALLNADQCRAHDIIEVHLQQHLCPSKPSQLLMLVLSPGGTGKLLLISTITETFTYYDQLKLLAKTASSGVAASLIGGQTLHSWAGISIKTNKDTDNVPQASPKTAAKRRANIGRASYLLHDEAWMGSKTLLGNFSQICSQTKASDGSGDAHLPFGGLNIIMFGDPHQFPPVRDEPGALYRDRPDQDSERAQLGQELYLQFTKVVILKEQRRITDPVRNKVLLNLREGYCNDNDIREIRKLDLTDPSCDVPDFTQEPWSEAVLVTPRHAVRNYWNEAALARHSSKTGNRTYIAPAEDVTKDGAQRLNREQRHVIAGMKEADSGRLPERTMIAVGMRAMVVSNIATEADLANGTRGTVAEILLDHREVLLAEPDKFGRILLRYPPAGILFRPDIPPKESFQGLPLGLVPISPTEVGFTIKLPGGQKVGIKCRQLAIMPGYAFTDYRAQGQTIEYVIVDLGQPPGKQITPFGVYVALSRSRGRDNIRLLRCCDDSLFNTHPSLHLFMDDAQLAELDKETLTPM